MRFGLPRFGPKPPVQPGPSSTSNGRRSEEYLEPPIAERDNRTEPEWGYPIIEVNDNPWPIVETVEQAPAVTPQTVQAPVAEAEPELEPSWQTPASRFAPVVAAVYDPEPEPIFDMQEPAPEPDEEWMPVEVVALEPLPMSAWQLEPEPEPEPIVATPEPELEPEPVVAIPEPEPEPVVAVVSEVPEASEPPAPPVIAEPVPWQLPALPLRAVMPIDATPVYLESLQPDRVAEPPQPEVVEIATQVAWAAATTYETDPSKQETGFLSSLGHVIPQGASVGADAAGAPAEEVPPVIAVTPPVNEGITSLQGIALVEELKQVSEGLWSFKRYLEQYQNHLSRELETKLAEVTTALAALEEQASTLKQEFTVGLHDEDKLGAIERTTPALAQHVQQLHDTRAAQSQTLVLRENIGTVIERYSDLLDKVSLMEGNVRRYMKSIDGSAKSQIRQSQRQEFVGSSAIIRSQEMERARIAREIHDGPAQAIANVILRLDLVEKMMNQRPELVGREFAKMKEIAQGALNEIRGFIFDLRPMTLQDLGLTATLKKIVQGGHAFHDCHVELILEGSERSLSAEQELAIFRIAQEALTNVKKHAQASNAYVHLKYLPTEVVLIVEDDGRGFEPHKNANGEYTHFGLIGMQERADDIDGDLQVISQKGRGTKVIFSLRTE
ncbi:MAG: histidine kinase [bacterium]